MEVVEPETGVLNASAPCAPTSAAPTTAGFAGAAGFAGVTVGAAGATGVTTAAGRTPAAARASTSRTAALARRFRVGGSAGRGRTAHGVVQYDANEHEQRKQQSADYGEYWCLHEYSFT